MQVELKKVSCLGCSKELWIPANLPDSYVCNACSKLHLNQEAHDFEQEAKDEKDFGVVE